MIQKFLVEVRRNSVIVYHEDDLPNVHYHAKIDGFDYAYQIIANTMSFNKPCGGWFKRGGQQVHYHAHNQGNVIQWLPVTQDFKHEAMSSQSRSELVKWMIMQKK